MLEQMPWFTTDTCLGCSVKADLKACLTAALSGKDETSPKPWGQVLDMCRRDPCRPWLYREENFQAVGNEYGELSSTSGARLSISCTKQYQANTILWGGSKVGRSLSCASRGCYKGPGWLASVKGMLKVSSNFTASPKERSFLEECDQSRGERDWEREEPKPHNQLESHDRDLQSCEHDCHYVWVTGAARAAQPTQWPTA